MNDILIGALSAWSYGVRRDRCEATWAPELRRLGCQAVYLMGQASIGRAERHGDLLVLPCVDDYPSLPQRTRLFCRWALTQPNWQYLFKCDDDTFLASARFAAYDLRERHYVGAEWQPGVGYGSGGAGYFLSRTAAAIVAERLLSPTGAEDLLVGRVLKDAGVAFSIEPRLVAFGNNERRPRPDNDLISTHAVSPELIFASHREVRAEYDLLHAEGACPA